MAKHGRRRPYLAGRIDITLIVGALATKDVTVQVETGVLEESAWLSSVKCVWSMNGFTEVVGDGPLYVGVAHSDYSGAEIEEWIENTGSWARGDKIAQEMSARKIRQVGIFDSDASSAAGLDHLNDGRPITTKCGWNLTTGDTVKMWVYNAGAGGVTSGAAMHVLGHANLWPSG